MGSLERERVPQAEVSGRLGRPLQARLRHWALIPRAEGSCYLVGCGNLGDIVEVGVL